MSTAWRSASQSFRRYVAANVPEETRRSQVEVLRTRTRPRPGEQAQIDYGQLGRWLDPVDREAAHGLGVRDGAGAARGTCSCGRC